MVKETPKKTLTIVKGLCDDWVMICVDCGKRIKGDDIKGSMKHPYCHPCFDKKYKDYDEYFAMLRTSHP